MSTNDASLLDDEAVVERIHDHLDHGTTHMGETSWREPVENYVSPDRFEREMDLLRRSTVVFCPSAALAESGSFLARDVAGVPLVAIRGDDGVARVFRNACRHRGVQVTEGHGCKQAFVCPYHGWSYGTNGDLRHVPHDHGFPDLDRSTRGLTPVSSVEVGGLLFVDLSGSDAVEPSLPIDDLFPDGHTLLRYDETVVEANWKLFMESFLEGYHIRSTHKTTFYPIQYDNVNWIEHVGNSTRVAYPYQSIEKLRSTPLAPGGINYYLTYVYQLFPTAVVATTPGAINTIVLEPLSPSSTRMVSFFAGVPRASSTRSTRRPGSRPDYAAALEEDLSMVRSAQRGLASGANEYLEFGLFEDAIVRFHQRLDEALSAPEVAVSVGGG